VLITTQLADPEWVSSRAWLMDQTTVSEMKPLGLPLITQQAERFRGFRQALDGGRIALVAHLYFDEAKEIEKFLDEMNVTAIAFNDLTTACIYLGLEVRWTSGILRNLRAELRRLDPQPAGLKVSLIG
jgi:hypothetical protein